MDKQAVPDARGHRSCHDAMRRLKEAVRACRQHKQRVQLTVSFLRIKIRDEKTWALLHHHPVNRISFISQDTCNAQVVAYIYVSEHDSYHYIAINIENVTTELQAALVTFFQVVLRMKDRITGIAPQEWRQKPQAWAQTTSTGVDWLAPCPRNDLKFGRIPGIAVRREPFARTDPADGELDSHHGQSVLT
ncbi:hypothetical protein V5799_010804 [Amblyomma americanum]|uniref:PID domain-containing protein n=1 Tax=Amblyomma americanum TaxID=6943 RepID=A0AAQ4EIN9_AMBAM